MLDFNKPCHIGKEEDAVREAIMNQKLSGNGPFSDECTNWLETYLNCHRAILTPSCTAALEMTALLTEAGPGDDIVMPSYTFVTTANAFVLRGASIRFADVDPATMNLSPEAVEQAITPETKVIVVVHYAGISSDMDAIMEIARHYRLWVVEDAAQALTSTYKGKALGTIGHMGTFSFHETKNITCGEGGALIVNDSSLAERAEILQEKGTDRKQFARGMVDKYTWRDVGSSFLLSELNAAYLSVQLEHAGAIMTDRMRTWQAYNQALKTIPDLTLPAVPEACEHNAHMFYIKTERRSELQTHLKNQGITAATHYVPLHTSPAGRRFGEFAGTDNYTTAESDKLLRLPLYHGMNEKDVDHVISHVKGFFTV
ncbi:dTDP-4-amino-4,6-dideoxygalactose transaminase [Barrientosiimonas marina]|uniref:dTDP-4-amino-4,6-dideoxygalactose transaminase n=1 Tax=Lentibacillus kimchii TaxID=1542911 RepID=A0ABW2UXB6_9BACI